MANPFDEFDAGGATATADAPPPDPSLDDSLAGGLKGYGSTFEDAGTKYNLDPALLAAIAMHETGNGTSRALLQGNNAMGISPNNGGPASFDNVEDSIYQQARTIARNPAYSQFRKTGDIDDLGAVYAPVGAPNDQRGLNSDWVNGVSKFYSRIKGATAPTVTIPETDENDPALVPVSGADASTPPAAPTAAPASRPAPAAAAPSAPTNVFDKFDAPDDPKAAAIADYNRALPTLQKVQDIEGQADDALRVAADPKNQVNTFDQFDVPTPNGSMEITATNPVNPFDSFDDGELKDIPFKADAPATAPMSGGQSFVNSADKTLIGGALGQTVALGGKVLSLFDDNVDQSDDSTNPYMAVGEQIQNAADAKYPTDPTKKGANKAGEVVGGILPILASGPLAPVTAGATTAGGTYQDVMDRGGSSSDAIAAAAGTGTIAVGATLVGGPLGILAKDSPALASATWGQLAKNTAWGGLRAMSRTYWDMAAQNVGNAELTNLAVPDPQKQAQTDMLTSSLADALWVAPLGGVTHTIEQGTAEASVARAAQAAGQDKASFITNTAQFYDTLANNDSLTPQEKMVASTKFLGQFSPDVQKVIAAHVQNVKSTMDAIQQAQAVAANMAKTAPLTAEASLKSNVLLATQKMQATAQDIEKGADENEAQTLADLQKANTPEPTPQPEASAPVAESTPAEIVPPTDAPSPEPVKTIPTTEPNVQTQTTPAPAEPLPADTTVSPAPEKVATPAEQPGVPAGEGVAPVAAEREAALPVVAAAPAEAPAESAAVMPEAKISPEAKSEPETKEASAETIMPQSETASPVSETKAPVPETVAMPKKVTRTTLVEQARGIGVPEPTITKATNKDLADIITTHHLGQKPVAEADLVDAGEGTKIDPRIKDLPQRQKNAVLSFIAGAKKAGLRGIKNFVISTDHDSPVSTNPARQNFDTVYINPNELARSHDILSKRGGDKAVAAVNQKWFNHEFIHLQGAKAIESDWKKAGSPGKFADFYYDRMREIYDAMSPAARQETANRYGDEFQDVNPNLFSEGYDGAEAPNDKMLPARVGEEYLRRLVELRGSAADSEALTDPTVGKAAASAQTKRLLKSAKSNTPLLRWIQSTAARLKNLAAKLSARGTPDAAIERMLDQVEGLIRETEKPPKKGGNQPAAKPFNDRLFRVDPLSVAGAAGVPDDFDYFGDHDEAAPELRGGDGVDRNNPPTPEVPGASLEAGTPPTEGYIHAPVTPVDQGGGRPGALPSVLGKPAGSRAGAPVPGEVGTRGTGGSGSGGNPDGNSRPSLTPEAERLLASVQSRSESPASATEGPGFLRPNEGQRKAPSGYERADQREQHLENEIERLKDVPVPAEEQQRFHGLTQTLGRLQFYGNDAARDRATGNAFVKVMLEAKRWIQKHGSLDAEDSRGNGFGARAIIRNALLDEGDRASLESRTFAGKTPEITGEKSPEPKGEEAPGEEDGEVDAGNESRSVEGFDPSEDDPEKIQEAFGEPNSQGSSVEGVSNDTPRKRAQDAVVDRNVAAMHSLLTPYTRRLIELWHDTPDNPRASNPKWVSLAQKEFGHSKEEILHDFNETIDTLRQAAQKRGLVRDDFTRIAGAAKVPEEPNERDPLTGIHSEIVPGQSRPASRGQPRERAKSARARAGLYAVARSLSRVFDEAHSGSGTVFGRLPPDARGRLLRERLVRPAADIERLAREGTPAEKELAKTVQRFRQDVPLLPHDDVVTRQLEASPQNFRPALDAIMHENRMGRMSDAEAVAQMAPIAASLGARTDPDPEVTYAVLNHLAQRAQPGHYTMIGRGGEARAFKDDRGAVYKTMPINHEVFDVGQGTARGPVGIEPQRVPLLASLHGNIPLVDRVAHMNDIPGAARTELAGITDHGIAIVKQHYLGEDRPSQQDISSFARQNGHAELMSQAPVRGFNPDSNAQPILTKNSEGKPVLMLDVNGRNARHVDGKTIPFDPVTRELSPQEVQANPDLRRAWSSLFPPGPPPTGGRRAGAAPVRPDVEPEKETFADRVSQDPRVNQAVRDAVFGREYTPIPNNFTAAEALHALDTDGVDKSYQRVMEDNTIRTGLDARQRVALGQQLMVRLQKMGEAGLNRALNVVEKLSTYGKDLGQAVQAFSLWSRLTPAGALTAYTRIMKPVIDEARAPHEDVITAVKDTLQKTRTDAADGVLERDRINQIVDEAEKLSDKQAKVENAKPIWQRYMEATAEALSNLPRGLRSPTLKGALDEFAGRLTQNLKAAMKEHLPESPTSAKAPKMPAEARLGEIYKNEPAYKEAWDAARLWISQKYADDPAKLDHFDDALADAFQAPVGLHDKALTETLKAQGISLRDLVKQWAGKQGATRDDLVKGIVDRMTLTPEQAEKVGGVLANRFNIMLEQARQKELARVIRSSGKSKLTGQPQTIARKIMEASNLGLTDDEAAYNAIADAYKLPKYDPKVVADLTARANEIQKMLAEGREGFQTDKKTADMLNVLENLKEAQASHWRQLGRGLMAIYYGNILGPTTIIRKTVSETANAVGELSTMTPVMMKHDPMALPHAVMSFARGLADRGAADAKEIIINGSGLRRGDGSGSWIKPGHPFERGTPFGTIPVLSLANKPLSVFYRYVGRSLEAGAAFFYSGANEARANMLAYRLAMEDQRAGRTPNDASISQRVSQILGTSNDLRAKFEAQAKTEGLSGREAKLRVAELMDASRPADLRLQARDFATRATFQQEPEGLLGRMATAAMHITHDYPIFKTLLPFIRIPANVLNETLDYTPWGYSRAYRWASLKGDDDRRYQQLVKATAGSVAMAGLGAMFAQNEDDKDPALMVTADGPADYNKKQQLMDQGWAPYTIKIGGHYIGYREMPIGFALGLLGRYFDAKRYGNLPGDDPAKRLAFTMLSAAGEFTSRSWVANTSDFLDILRNNNPDRAGQAFEGFVGRTAGGFVPLNQSSIRILDKLWDPTHYTSQSMTGLLMSQVAFARRLNDPMLDALGQPVQERPFSAFAATQTADPVWQALADKGVWLPATPKTEWLGDRQMTEDEHYRFVQQSGQKIREALQNGGIDQMNNLDAEAAQEYLNCVVKAARDPVKAELRAEGIENGTILSDQKPKGNK